MTKQVNIAEAKAQLSNLVDQAEKGHSVIIARNGRPVAQLVPLTEKRQKFNFGFAKDLLTEKQIEELTRPWTKEELELLFNGPVK
jgi:prevent-host-death family protein